MGKKTIPCPHCGAEVIVYRNGKKLCPDCGETFVVSGLPTARSRTSLSKQTSGESETSMNPQGRMSWRKACPHCGAEVTVYRNGKKLCPDCGETFVVSGLPIKRTKPNFGLETPRASGEAVAPVRQTDGVSCGWATTLWLLRSFGFHPDPAALREELNTDGNHGVRGVLNDVFGSIGDLFGANWRNAGTLPTAILAAVLKRGLTIKNPIRPESPAKFVDYLNETMDEGGRGLVLLWRQDFSLWHWMGVDRKNGNLRVMDPLHGWYVPFEQGIDGYKKGSSKPNFLVVGIVRR